MAQPNPVWRLVLCDLWGNALSILNVASDIQLSFALNRPATLTFTVPSDSPLVNTLYRSTSQVYLDVGRRLIKAYRKTDVDTAASELADGWDLKFVGRVWDVGDDGDEDSTRTAVTCYDPLYDLSKRVIRRSDGSFNKPILFGHVRGEDIIHKMIHRSNVYGESPTLVNVADGTWTDTAYQSQTFDPGSYILQAIVSMCDTGTVDIVPTYLDVNDGSFSLPHPYHMILSAKPRRGSTKKEAILAYGGPPRNSTEFHRTRSMSTFANDVHLWGKSATGHRFAQADATSVASYGSFEHVEIASDLYGSTVIDSLGSEILNLCKDPRDLLNFVPAPEFSAAPFTQYNVGDSVTGNVGAPGGNPETRDHAYGLLRVYGFTVAVDDEYGEKVTQIITSPQDLGGDV